ncbi:MAG: translation initiation factor IF-3 [Nitrospirae bacterium]|nr:translation initiation factor IF-3 [Nitrospirota bacterium]
MAEPRIRVNREIRIKEVRVIGPEGEQLGILPTFEAIKKAVEFGLDLVEVAPTSKPPVCRIMDFGKYKYELAKKHHGARQHQRSMQLKEVKVRPYTDKHDIEIKIRNVRRFLEDKNKAKVTLTFRGREMAYRETAKGIMISFADGVKDIGVVEVPAKMEGNSMIMIISPRSDAQKSKGTGTESVITAEGREDV